MSRGSNPVVAFIGCAAIWGSTFLAIRIGNDSVPALWACALRLLLAAVALNGYLFATGQRWPTGQALKASCWYGFLEFGICLPLLYWGERDVSSGVAAVLYAVSPIAAMTAAKLLGMEDWSKRRLVAACFALAGIVLIFWRQIAGGAPVAGLFSIGVAATLGAIAPLVLQRGPKQSAIGSNAVGTLVAFPLALIASFVCREAHPVPSSVGQFFPILYLAIASSVVAFGLFAWLVTHWSATTVAFLGVIVPVLAMILGALVRHESFNPETLGGALVVILAVAVVIRSERPGRSTEPSLSS
jgi:drug/metabolite transporter (DMT)-like permease